MTRRYLDVTPPPPPRGPSFVHAFIVAAITLAIGIVLARIVADLFGG